MTIYGYTDGASRGNPGESGIGVVLRDEQGSLLFSGCGYIGTTTNNVAEYRALLACIASARTLECEKLIVHSDSQLMVRQIIGTYRVKDRNLAKYHGEVRRELQASPFAFEIVHIEREKNRDADILANTGIDSRQPWSNCPLP